MANPTNTLTSDTFNAPNGWNKWIYLKNVYPTSIQSPDASLPYIYTPANAFWLKSLIIHCLIPWINTLDAFSAFMLGGGASGSLIGSISGLAVVSEIFGLSVKGTTMGVGRGSPAPEMGYCIGSKFKQQVYTRLDVQNDGLQRTVIPYFGIELLQNYVFKRAYVKYGDILKYTNTASTTNNSFKEYVLSIGINKPEPPPSNIDLKGEKITILKSQNNTSKSHTFSVNVLSIKNNWDIVIDRPPEDISIGDFYQLNSTWCIEDPYLTSGFWRGQENTITPTIASSGLNLYVTSQDIPYTTGKFLGYYVWVPDTTSVTTTTTTLEGQTASTTTLPLYYQPIVGYPMNDANDFTWAFGGFGNSPTSGVYRDDERYREIKIEIPDGEGAVVKYIPRQEAGEEYYAKIIDPQTSTYVRVEISGGGKRGRDNYFSPCLKGGFIKCGSKLYRILSHVTFNIIDVSILSVDGTTTFDPKGNQDYSILNEYAWFINEHYDGRINKSNTGIFQGTITAIKDKDISIQTLGDTYVSTYKKNGLSFVDRYQKDVKPSDMKKMFVKYEGWQLISPKNSYSIKSVDFSKTVANFQTYPIIVTLNSIPSNLSVGTIVYITFGTPYKTVGRFSPKNGYNLNATVKAGSSGRSGGFIVSDSLCIDGEYISAPYVLNITQSDRIGYCDGVYFGLAINGSAQSNYSQTIMMTTPRTARGVASLFHYLRQEDWVIYEDAVTQRITARRGSANFTEYPKKDMIVIGVPLKQEVSEGNTDIKLNTDYQWLRRLAVQFASNSSSKDIAVLFGIGDPNNIYGFYVSGDGFVNLGFLSKEGKKVGDTPSSTYQGEGYNVSPVFLYTPNTYQRLKTLSVDVGVETKKEVVYLNGGDIEKVTLDYVSDNQTISQTGYFDVIRLSNGENIFIYGSQVGEFNLTTLPDEGSNTDTILNNSTDNSSKWSNPNAVMMLGTYDDDYVWATPLVHRIDSPEYSDYRYPMMLMNSVDYLGCIYNPLNETLAIFVRSTEKDNSYLGCYIKRMAFDPVGSLMMCTSTEDSTSNNPAFKFLWLPPLIPDEIIDNPQQFWTDTSNVIEDNYSYIGPEENEPPQDYFVRVMGPGAVRPFVTNGQEFGIISTTILSDGTYMVLFDTEVGIRAIFSNDNAHSWFYSDIVFARDARSGLLLHQNSVNNPILCYITSQGIEVKILQISDICMARDMSGQAGISSLQKELELQEIVNSRPRFLIGSGVVDPQRLSGYITSDGVTKLFFYDDNGLLRCMDSKDGTVWNVTNNF